MLNFTIITILTLVLLIIVLLINDILTITLTNNITITKFKY